jgi:hypothetical protein
MNHRRVIDSISPGTLLRIDNRAQAYWVPWFDISNIDRSVERPRPGDVMLYLGRTNTFLSHKTPVYGWHFLARGRYLVVFNDDFARGIEVVCAPEEK